MPDQWGVLISYMYVSWLEGVLISWHNMLHHWQGVPYLSVHSKRHLLYWINHAFPLRGNVHATEYMLIVIIPYRKETMAEDKADLRDLKERFLQGQISSICTLDLFYLE